MSFTVQDFFRPIPLYNKPNEQDYEKVAPFIQLVRSVSLLAYQAFYLVDYYKRSFAYVSDNPLFLCGRKACQVLQDGFLFYFKHVPPQELEMLLQINEAGFAFYKTIPLAERLEYAISYDFHLKQPKGGQLLVNHQLTPVLLDKDSNIWIALCLVSLSSASKPGNVKIKKRNGARVFALNLEQQRWKEQRTIKLKSREREILALSVQGLTVQKMAERLCLSADTIKFHKKNIFKTLKAKSTAEAIATATNLLLI